MSNKGGNIVAAMTWGRLIQVITSVSALVLPEDWTWIEEQINEEGRALTITLPGSVGGESWRGNIAGTPTAAIGVFVRYTAKQIDGDHIKRADQKVLLIPDETINIEEGTKIVDSLDDSSWFVIKVEKITNKSDILFYILQVRQ